MKFYSLRVTATPKDSEDKPKRAQRVFLFNAGMVDNPDPGGVFRNGSVRARAALGDEAPYYNISRVVIVPKSVLENLNAQQ